MPRYKTLLPAIATLAIAVSSTPAEASDASGPKPKKCSIADVGVDDQVGTELGLLAAALAFVAARRRR